MTAAIDYGQYTDEKVILTLEGFEEPLHATVEAAKGNFLIYKPKGKSNTKLVDTAEIKGIELAPEADAELKARRLNPVTLDTVKRHLADRHGYPLSEVNGLKPEDAFGFHEEIDHKPLSHFHAEAPAREDKSEGTPAAS